MRSVLNFNADWTFHDGASEALTRSAAAGRSVALPHNAVELPLAYFDERCYQRAFTYQKLVTPGADWADREVAIVVDGAMANAAVFVNGEQVAAHRDGYTPFEARLTGHLKPGANLIAITVDGSENPEIPPFGGAIDYLTYAGIYRDVCLRVTAPVWIEAVRVETPDALADRKHVTARVTLANPQQRPLSGTLAATLLDADARLLASASVEVTGSSATIDIRGLAGVALWDIDAPVMYRLQLALETPHGPDEFGVAFGFRTAQFTTEGFLLNGRALKLRGLNRHQSFPYVGYALPRAAQERDAEIIKRELRCNIVRTSHYPQSPWFLDHCDRIGLLVLEELPGWQHIGGAAWKAESIENVRRMIRRDWNHPSIVMWGVRINESQDDHDFYAGTNRAARELDESRQTGGIRFLTHSELLEDVYTLNDFILGTEELGGERARTPLRSPRETTGLAHRVPYLVTEYMGHMYPTKSWDQEQRQAEHVRRHLEVLNAAYGDAAISGAIGWCAFDYNTHKDFGSGDRICHHGVMDMFREPKFAAFAYASQDAPARGIVLEPVTFWARGERNIGGILPLIVLTNCDEVELRYGDGRPKRIGPDRDAFPHLPHPPVVIDRKHFSPEELGQWGKHWHDGLITGYLDDRQVAQVRLVADPVATTLAVVPDTETIAADGGCVRVMIRALDQVGRKLPFLFDPVAIDVTGAGRRIGPELVAMRAGSFGFWVAATGAPGAVAIRVASPRFGTVEARLIAR
jgi:beta-galactosidase